MYTNALFIFSVQMKLEVEGLGNDERVKNMVSMQRTVDKFLRKYIYFSHDFFSRVERTLDSSRFEI